MIKRIFSIMAILYASLHAASDTPQTASSQITSISMPVTQNRHISAARSLLDVVTTIKDLQKIILGYLYSWKEDKVIVTDSHALAAAVISPDGKYLAYGAGNKIVLRDTVHFNILHVLEDHSDQVSALAFSPDSKHLASGSYDHAIKIWKINTGKLIKTLSGFYGHTNIIESIAYHPTGEYLISGSDDRTIKHWATDTFQCLKTRVGHYRGVSSVAYSPNGKSIASGSYDGCVKIWDALNRCSIYGAISDGVYVPVKTLQADQQLKSFTTRYVLAVYSPNSKYLISTETHDLHNRIINFWDAAIHEFISCIPSGVVTCLAFFPKSQYLTFGDEKNVIQIWDYSTIQAQSINGTPEKIASLEGHTDQVNSIAIAPNGKYIVSSSQDKTLRLWKNEAHEIEFPDLIQTT